MTRDSWTRRLDDRVLGPSGLSYTFGLMTILFVAGAVSAAIGGAWFQVVIGLVLAVFSAQAARTQWRRRPER